MASKKRSTKFYLLVSFIASIIVFSAGIGLGLVLDSLKSASIGSSIDELRDSITDAELELLLMDYFGGNMSCNYLVLKSEELSEQSTDLGSRLDLFEQSDQIDTNAYLPLKKEYTRVLIKNWLTLENIKSSCTMNYSTILYFYNNNNCSACVNQAYVLNYYKNLLKNNVMIFAIDSNLNISIVRMLVSAYNTQEYPSLVVNGQLFSGYQDSEFLGSLIGVQI